MWLHWSDFGILGSRWRSKVQQNSWWKDGNLVCNTSTRKVECDSYTHLDSPGPLYTAITKRLKFYANTSHTRGPLHFADKDTSTSPEIWESTLPQTLVRLQFIYSSYRGESVHVWLSNKKFAVTNHSSVHCCHWNEYTRVIFLAKFTRRWCGYLCGTSWSLETGASLTHTAFITE